MLGFAALNPTYRSKNVYNPRNLDRDRKNEITPIALSALNLELCDRVVALMTMNDLMDSQVFEVFIGKFLVPQLWSGAVVVMDNLAAHKLASIAPMIEAVGAFG